MKKWRITRSITIVLLVIFLLYLLIDAIFCMNMTYPHPMLGVDALNWVDQFSVDLLFIAIIWGVPLIVDIVLMVVSIIKIKNDRNSKENS